MKKGVMSMYFNEFSNVRISALAAAVPDHREQLINYAAQFSTEEIEKFCKSTGIQERYSSVGVGTTAADLCVAAAEEIFQRTGIKRDSIDGLILLTQTPDYMTPPTSCIIQYPLGLDNCGLVYDSSIGCSGFPFGIQMACADLMAGCEKILLLVGDSFVECPGMQKDDLLFGDCGVAVVLEKVSETVAPIKVGIRTIGKGYPSLISPYGMQRHPLSDFYRDRGLEDALAYNNKGTMHGTDVFTFSIKDAPKATKEFLAHFDCQMDDYDLISIHQANKMIVDNVAKRVQAPAEKVLWSLNRYGNTRGSSTAMNICDYVQRENLHKGMKRILNLAFGVGLNVALAGFELDLSVVLPVVKTSAVFDDGIDSFSYFTKEGGED